VTGPASALTGELANYANTTGKLLGRLAVPSGGLVGADTVQTLQNKTINGAANTLTVRANIDLVGNLPIARLDSGTSASITTFWRGDGHWGAPTADPLPGSVVQTSYDEYTAQDTYTTAYAVATVQPTDGMAIIAIPFTPLYANSKLLLRATGICSAFRSPPALTAYAMFIAVDNVTVLHAQLVGHYSDGAYTPWSLETQWAPGAGAKTYRLRGVCGGSGQSIYFNGYQGAEWGSNKCTMVIQEIKQ
jgi:hypothetical protein